MGKSFIAFVLNKVLAYILLPRFIFLNNLKKNTQSNQDSLKHSWDK